MILSILTWICIVLGSIIFLLLVLPFQVILNGMVDDREGFNYKLMLSWAFGFITVIAVNGKPITIFLFGFKIFSLSLDSWQRQKEPKKKRTSARRVFPWIKKHYQQIAMIVKQFFRAIFLKGTIVGWIGLPDPADTARIGLLSQLMEISKERFKLTIICVYDQEIIKINGRAQITLIIGYLGLIALIQLLKKDTRLMIRGLART